MIVIVLLAGVMQTPAAQNIGAEIPFQFREGLLWIDVAVPQAPEHLNFLVDTGAGVSVINLSTAKRMGLKLGRGASVQGVQTVLTGYWAESLAAEAGGVRLPEKYLAIDLEKLSSSCELRVDGLLGADFFRGRVVELDFEARKIRLVASDKGRTSREGLPLELRPCGMRVPLSVNGQKTQWVRLDTGCASALQWVTAHISEGCTRQMAIGLAELSIPQTTTNVQLGEHEFREVPTGLHRKPIFPGEAGLLGTPLLSQFSKVTIDAKAGRVIFQARQ